MRSPMCPKGPQHSEETLPVRRAGTVALVGRSNVGKSTLMNALLGEALAIVSPIPQTTRNRVLGVVRHEDTQIGLLDTPGLHKPVSRLGKLMNAAARSAVDDADVVLFVTCGTARGGSAPLRVEAGDRTLLADIGKGKPTILVLNKVDLIKPRSRMLGFIEEISKLRDFAAVVPISARREDGLERLLSEVAPLLPSGPALWSEDDLTDKPVRFFVSEFVREEIIHIAREELPYVVAVTVDSFDESSRIPRVFATIHVEREGQKPIIIGQGGTRLRDIGIAARERAEALLGHRIHLELFVRVTPDWTENARLLSEFGYDEQDRSTRERPLDVSEGELDVAEAIDALEEEVIEGDDEEEDAIEGDDDDADGAEEDGSDDEASSDEDEESFDYSAFDDDDEEPELEDVESDETWDEDDEDEEDGEEEKPTSKSKLPVRPAIPSRPSGPRLKSSHAAGRSNESAAGNKRGGRAPGSGEKRGGRASGGGNERGGRAPGGKAPGNKAPGNKRGKPASSGDRAQSGRSEQVFTGKRRGAGRRDEGYGDKPSAERGGKGQGGGRRDGGFGKSTKGEPRRDERGGFSKSAKGEQRRDERSASKGPRSEGRPSRSGNESARGDRGREGTRGQQPRDKKGGAPRQESRPQGKRPGGPKSRIGKPVEPGRFEPSKPRTHKPSDQARSGAGGRRDEAAGSRGAKGQPERRKRSAGRGQRLPKATP